MGTVRFRTHDELDAAIVEGSQFHFNGTAYKIESPEVVVMMKNSDVREILIEPDN